MACYPKIRNTVYYLVENFFCLSFLAPRFPWNWFLRMSRNGGFIIQLLLDNKPPKSRSLDISCAPGSECGPGPLLWAVVASDLCASSRSLAWVTCDASLAFWAGTLTSRGH